MPPLKGDNGISGLFPAQKSGVWGDSDSGYGVAGTSRDEAGVFGRSDAGPAAVQGESGDRADGVLGRSAGGRGVFGVSKGNVSGVTGYSASLGVEGVALGGPSVLTARTGVSGFSGEGVGVFGRSHFGAATLRVGVMGQSDSICVMGLPRTANPKAIGVVGVAPSLPATGGTGWAGIFDGVVQVRGFLNVQGDLTVTGQKSAAVSHPDGSHRLMYCLESPESWFEDFGRGNVVRGRAQVELDPEYAAMVRSDDYYVFLTPEGDSKGLFVSEKSPSGFEVREQQKGRSSLSFSYRVVARRKDVDGERLQKVELRTNEADEILDRIREDPAHLEPPQRPESPGRAELS